MLLFLTLICPAQEVKDELGLVDVRCGAYCLYAALRGAGLEAPAFEAFQTGLGEPSRRGYSLLDLETAAKEFGACTLVVKTDLSELSRIEEPFACVALLRTGHYVNLYDVSAETVSIADPPHISMMRRGLFEELWPGYALLVSTKPLVLPRSSRVGAWTVGVAAAFAGLCVLLAVVKRRAASTSEKGRGPVEIRNAHRAYKN